MTEQGVQEGIEHTPPRGPRVGCVVTYPYHLGVACQEVKDPVAEGGVESQGLSFVMSFEGTMVLNAELKSMNSILT